MSKSRGAVKRPKPSLSPCLPTNSLSEANENALIESTQHSRLLSLPAEIRMLIWEAVARIPIGIPEMWSRNPEKAPPKLTDKEFSNLKYSQHNWLVHHTHEDQGADPMGWLRTNHQIHEEGKPVFDELSSLRICNTVEMAILMCPQWSPSILSRNTLQYLSFCYRIAIQQVPQGGFTFQLANQHFSPAIPLHIAPELPSLDISTPQRRKLQEHMPALNEIRLRLIFFCPPRRSLSRINRQERLNTQGRPSDQSRSQDALVFRGSDEEVKYVAYNIVYESLLGNFVGSSRVKVHVHVQMDRIEHDFGNNLSNPEEACWCKNRRIDPETFPVTFLTGAIQEALAAD